MTLEEQFAQVAAKTEFYREESVRMAAIYLCLINQQLGPGKIFYSESDCDDNDNWSIEQQNVWRYLYDRTYVKYDQIRNLLSSISTAEEVLNLLIHCLWMSAFCVLTEDETEVDELIEQANECENCRRTVWIYMAHWLLHDLPMSFDAISVIVHHDFDDEFLSSLKGLALKEAERFTGIGCV